MAKSIPEPEPVPTRNWNYPPPPYEAEEWSNPPPPPAPVDPDAHFYVPPEARKAKAASGGTGASSSWVYVAVVANLVLSLIVSTEPIMRIVETDGGYKPKGAIPFFLLCLLCLILIPLVLILDSRSLRAQGIEKCHWGWAFIPAIGPFIYVARRGRRLSDYKALAVFVACNVVLGVVGSNYDRQTERNEAAVNSAYTGFRAAVVSADGAAACELTSPEYRSEYGALLAKIGQPPTGDCVADATAALSLLNERAPEFAAAFPAEPSEKPFVVKDRAILMLGQSALLLKSGSDDKWRVALDGLSGDTEAGVPA